MLTRVIESMTLIKCWLGGVYDCVGFKNSVLKLEIIVLSLYVTEWLHN